MLNINSINVFYRGLASLLSAIDIYTLLFLKRFIMCVLFIIFIGLYMCDLYVDNEKIILFMHR